MSTLIIALFTAPITAISARVIDDCLEWKENIDIKILSIKIIGYTVILAALTYPFFMSLAKKGFSYESLAIAYIFGFGYLLPIIRQFIGLPYIRFSKPNLNNK
jgi:hypothetical protein